MSGIKKPVIATTTVYQAKVGGHYFVVKAIPTKDNRSIFITSPFYSKYRETVEVMDTMDKTVASRLGWIPISERVVIEGSIEMG